LPQHYGYRYELPWSTLRSTAVGPSARRRFFFEARQPVRELDPAEPVTGPDVTDGRKCVRVIEAAGGHVDGMPIVSPPVRQRGAAAPTECPRDRRRRVVFNRFTHGESQVIHIHVRPWHDRRRGCLSTTAALTCAADYRFALESIPYRPTQTSALDGRAHGAPLLVVVDAWALMPANLSILHLPAAPSNGPCVQ